MRQKEDMTKRRYEKQKEWWKRRKLEEMMKVEMDWQRIREERNSKNEEKEGRRQR